MDYLLRNNSLEREHLELDTFFFVQSTHARTLTSERMNEHIESHFQKDMLYSNLLLIAYNIS